MPHRKDSERLQNRSNSSDRAGPIEDSFGRGHDYLRVSVTDRCNLRCGYCMPPEGIEHIKKEMVLSYEEILRVIRVGVSMGIRKVRITGGEPLVRNDIMDFIRGVSAIDDLEKIGITTNGLNLQQHLEDLKETRLQHVNISLDSLDKERFQSVTRGEGLQTVLEAIRSAVSMGFHVKVNAVALPDLNWSEIRSFLDLARDLDIAVRFIEYMPLDGEGWDPDAFEPVSGLKQRVTETFQLEPVDEPGVSETYEFADGPGRVGFIASLTEPFCETCSRLRLSSTGTLHSCLFAPDGVHLLPVLRNGGTDEEIAEKIHESVRDKWAGNPAYTGDWDPETEPPPQEFGFIRRIGG